MDQIFYAVALTLYLYNTNSNANTNTNASLTDDGRLWISQIFYAFLSKGVGSLACWSSKIMLIGMCVRMAAFCAFQTCSLVGAPMESPFGTDKTVPTGYAVAVSNKLST
jgi:hypothetical protein